MAVGESAEEIGLYGMRLCIDLGPGAPLSLVERTLGKPSETERLGSSVVGLTFTHKGYTCAIMMNENDDTSMGAAYMIDGDKLGMTGDDLLNAVVRAAEPVYGQPRQSGKAYFRVKSKYLEGHGEVSVSIRRNTENVVEIVQSFF
jgi:hypothetical protein